MTHDVLLVHSPDDRDAAWVCSFQVLLEGRGVRVRSYAGDPDPGPSTISSLEQLVSTSRFTMPVLTPRFSMDRFRDLQTLMAQYLGVESGVPRLVPIVREPCEARLGLRVLVCLDATDDWAVTRCADRLVRTLGSGQDP